MPDIEAMKTASIHRIVGPTILLGSGTYFDFEAPETAELTLEDVAYGLANSCRFAGQCVLRYTGRRVYYSVAEHCLRMSYLVHPSLAYLALMHELGEATCGDMVSPLKAICPEYKVVEKRCEAAAMKRFQVNITRPELIKHDDLRMLATERRDLMPWKGQEWQTVGTAEPFPDQITYTLSPMRAAEEFMIRYRQLGGPDL
jgi:hypothetical protein